MVISCFLLSKLSVSVVRHSQVINLSSGSLSRHGTHGTHRFWRLSPAPQPSLLTESSQKFWEEGITFSAPLQLCLFVSGRTHTGGASVMHPAWEFSFILSICQFDSFEFSQIYFFFYWEADSSQSLFVTDCIDSC